MARKRLGEILVQAGVLDEARLRAALAEQRRWGGHLGRILVDMKLITEEAMVQALSHQLNFPAVNLDTRPIQQEIIELIPGELAEQHSMIPFNVQGKFLDVAMADPTNLGIIDELRIRTRLNVRPYLAGPKMIERAISRYYGRGVGVATLQTPAQTVPDTGARMLEVTTDHGFRTAVPGIAATPPPGQASPAVTATRRSQVIEMPVQGGPGEAERDREIASLQARVQHLEALVTRDEDVLRKLMGLLIEKGLTTREEILERIK